MLRPRPGPVTPGRDVDVAATQPSGADAEAGTAAPQGWGNTGGGLDIEVAGCVDVET